MWLLPQQEWWPLSGDGGFLKVLLIIVFVTCKGFWLHQQGWGAWCTSPLITQWCRSRCFTGRWWQESQYFFCVYPGAEPPILPSHVCLGMDHYLDIFTSILFKLPFPQGSNRSGLCLEVGKIPLGDSLGSVHQGAGWQPHIFSLCLIFFSCSSLAVHCEGHP
jgi:hypothetical protein